MRPRKRTRTGAADVWVLEGHPLAPQYLLQALPTGSSCRVVSLEEALRRRAAKKPAPSVLLIDKDAHPTGSSATLQPIQAVFPGAKILLTGKSMTDDELLRLVLLGIIGFIAYDNLPNELEQAIPLIATGHLWIKREVLDKLSNYDGSLLPRGNEGSVGFTPREKAILELLQCRPSNRGIAAQMQISERTVKFHLENLFAKVGVQDRYSLADSVKSGKLHPST